MKYGGLGFLIFAFVGMFYGELSARMLIVTTSTSALHSGPGKTHKIVGKVLKAEHYEVLEEKAGWYKIQREGGSTGWVAGEAVTLEQSVPDSHPVTMAPRAAAIQRRVALVIGNAAYADNPLRNPRNDAADMATMLRQLDFDVTLLLDANQRTMAEAVRKFTTATPPGSMGLFYFSGHGVQIAEENYLIPIGTVYDVPNDVEHGAVKVNWVLRRMEEARMPVKLVILDACRNNPLGRSWTRGDRREGLANPGALTEPLTPSARLPRQAAADPAEPNLPDRGWSHGEQGEGLAPMEAVKGSLIAYSTSPGQTAVDGAGYNSPYTAHLLRQMPTPGQPVETMFKRVRLGVQQETNQRQIPWESSSLTGDFYFGGHAVRQPASKEEPQSLGGLAILGRVPGAEVWVNTHWVGDTRTGRALTWENLRPGTYRVTARKLGYAPWVQEVTVLANQQTEVVIDIKPLPERLVVKPASETTRAETQVNRGKPLLVAPTP